MIEDNTPRIIKILDALSQLLNVSFLPNHTLTTSNESISGRSYRMKWKTSKLIDMIFFWEKKPGHCERAYMSDLDRATKFTHSHTYYLSENDIIK